MPRIGLESLLEHFIFQNFLGGGRPNPRKERLLPINIHTINFEPPIYKSYIHPCYNRSVLNCITVYKYEFDKYMLVCANKRSLPTILKNYEFGIIFWKNKYFDLFFCIPPLSPPPPLFT